MIRLMCTMLPLLNKNILSGSLTSKRYPLDDGNIHKSNGAELKSKPQNGDVEAQL